MKNMKDYFNNIKKNNINYHIKPSTLSTNDTVIFGSKLQKFNAILDIKELHQIMFKYRHNYDFNYVLKCKKKTTISRKKYYKSSKTLTKKLHPFIRTHTLHRVAIGTVFTRFSMPRH